MVGRLAPSRNIHTTGLGEPWATLCAHHKILLVAYEMHGDQVYPGYRYTPFASLGSDYAEYSITCLSPAKISNIASCCSAFTVIADEALRRAFQVENSRLSVNKNNPFANVARQAAFTSGKSRLQSVLTYL